MDASLPEKVVDDIREIARRVDGVAGIEFGHAMVSHLAPRDLPQLSGTPDFEAGGGGG